MAAAESNQMNGSRWERIWPYGLFGLTAVAFLIRLFGAQESPAGDELYLYALVHDRSLGSTLTAVINQEKTPPLGFILSWATAHISPADLWMRAPSVLAGTALVPVSALLGRRVFGTRAGLAAGLFVATSPFLVFYSIEARGYSLAALLVTGATLSVLKATDDTARRRDWVTFGALSLGAVLTHYTAVFAIATLVVWTLVARPNSRRNVLLSSAGALALFAIWLPSFLTQFGHASDEARRIADQAPLAFSTVGRMVSRAAVGHPFLDLGSLPGSLAVGLILAGVAIALTAAIVARVRSGQQFFSRPSSTVALLLLLAATTLLGLLLASLQPHRSLLLTRNLMVSLPVWAVLAGALVARRQPLIAIASTLLVAAGLSIGTWNELSRNARPNMRAAATDLHSRWRPGDVILESAYATGPPLDQDLAIHLTGDQLASLLLTRNVGLKPFQTALKTGRSVFTITPIAGYTTVGLAPPPDIRSKFKLTWWKTWPGLVRVDAMEWTPVSTAVSTAATEALVAPAR